ncbi:SCO family protein [Paracoccus subflavus]|uniref:SCO family protein n=1 Tax=Paracoccus subflavus TaxID=2528244 RepID=A0A4Q9G4P4_9RHOB|nr:SCO family protein [Paracoccus subflavus]TBN43674.1 SCO family protein [Paracoccus subflavus]
MRRRSVILLGLGGAASAAAFTLGLGAWRSREGVLARQDPRLPLPLSLMDWRLTDHRGNAVSPDDWIGRPAMVFFGFTWCPDVCPTTLLDISDWLEELGSDADDLTVALITVDPERDRPEVLADYLANFDPRITGLTGTSDQVGSAAEGFRVTYQKVPREGEDYTMNHTAGVFLFHRDGRFGGIVDFHEDRRYTIPKIRRMLG